MGKLVNDIEHPISASIVGAVLDKVVGPDVIAVLRPQPDARSAGQPQPASFGLFIGDLQPLASPDALDPLVVDYPARLAQQPCDLAIAVAAVLLGKLDNIGGETPLVVTTEVRRFRGGRRDQSNGRRWIHDWPGYLDRSRLPCHG